MPAQLGFPKTARLRRRTEYLAVKASGKSFADGPLAASFRARPGEPSRLSAPAVARVGITVSSKVGESVIRSRVKRKIREAVRHELSSLPPVELVIVARASSVNASVAELRAWLRKAGPRIARGIA